MGHRSLSWLKKCVWFSGSEFDVHDLRGEPGHGGVVRQVRRPGQPRPSELDHLEEQEVHGHAAAPQHPAEAW